MRRQEFSLLTRHVDTESGAETAPLPTLRLQYDGSSAELRRALESADGTPLSGSDIDVSLRLKGDIEDEVEGVLAVADRLTGDFVCECNVEVATVFDFLSATERRASVVDGAPTYRIQFVAEATPIRTDELDTLLVYTPDGDLRESESLLPNGIQP